MPPTGPWRRLHVLHHRSCLLSRPSLCSNMTSPTARPVKTWRQDPHVPSATCPVPNGLSRGRSFRRSLSILRSPHPQQRQERPWWILEQRPTGVPGAVPNGTPSRHESRRRPRLPVARDGPKRLETSRDVSRAPTETGYQYTIRISYSFGHRATDDSESGMGLPHRQATKVDPTWEDKHLAITGSSHYN